MGDRTRRSASLPIDADPQERVPPVDADPQERVPPVDADPQERVPPVFRRDLDNSTKAEVGEVFPRQGGFSPECHRRKRAAMGRTGSASHPND